MNNPFEIKFRATLRPFKWGGGFMLEVYPSPRVRVAFMFFELGAGWGL